MPYDPSLPLPEERARHSGVGWNRAFTPVFTVARQALLFRIRIILFRIRTLLFPVNGPLESSHLELFRSLGATRWLFLLRFPRVRWHCG